MGSGKACLETEMPFWDHKCDKYQNELTWAKCTIKNVERCSLEFPQTAIKKWFFRIY